MSAVTDLRTKSRGAAKLAGIPANRFIGSLVIFSIAGTVERDEDGRRQVQPVKINQDLLAQWFDELELDKQFLPPRIKKVDAWRNASSQCSAHTYVIDGDNGEFEYEAELVVEEVHSDNEQVTRHVIRRQRNAGLTRESGVHLATLKFIRGGRTSKGKRHGGDHVRHAILTKVRQPDRNVVEKLIEDIEELYEDLSNNLHAPAIRGVVRNYLEALNAIAMRGSGGVYFVCKDQWDDLDDLQQLVRRIGQGCVLEEVPVLDTPDARVMATEALQTELGDDARKLLKKITEAREVARSKGLKVSPSRVAEADASYRKIMERAAQYTDNLGLPMGKAADALQTAYEALEQLRQQTFAKGKKKS